MRFSPLYFHVRRSQTLASLMLVAAILVTGCAVEQPAPAKKARPVVIVPQNWTGTYRGTVPCVPPVTPACTAQRIALTLLANNTYELETTVQRRGKPYTIVSKGRFEWDNTLTIITLASKDENARLRIGNGIAERLPSVNDNINDASIYRNYVLRKK